MGDRIGQSNGKTCIRLANIADEGQIGDAPLALDIELWMLAHGRYAAFAGMQSTLQRFVARAEADDVLAVFHDELVDALMHAFDMFKFHVFTQKIRLDRIGLELSEEGTGATIQCA